MKKLLAALLALALLPALAGCGTRGEAAETDENEIIENAFVEDDAPELEEEEPQGESIEIIESYAEALLQQLEVQEMIDAYAAKDMLYELETRQHTLVRKYTYLTEPPENAVQLLTEQFAAQEEQLIAEADAIKAEEPVIKLVAWEYYTVDGVLLASCEH